MDPLPITCLSSCPETTPIVIVTLSKLLLYICEKNTESSTEKNIFTSAYVNNISIEDYVRRIHKHGPINKQSDDVYLVSALIYMDKFLHSRNMALTVLNVHRIWLVSYLLAIKFLDDDHLNNKWFASVGGIPLQELNKLEFEFLGAIKFDLGLEQYTEYEQQLQSAMKGNDLMCVTSTHTTTPL